MSPVSADPDWSAGASKPADLNEVTARISANAPGPRASAPVSAAVHSPVNAPDWACPVRLVSACTVSGSSVSGNSCAAA